MYQFNSETTKHCQNEKKTKTITPSPQQKNKKTKIKQKTKHTIKGLILAINLIFRRRFLH